VRIFIAIDLPDAIRIRLGEVQKELGAEVDSARWVSAESLHLTLKFIGEIPEKRTEDIDQSLTALTWKAFPVAVRGLGFFPGARSPKVLWAGLEVTAMAGLAEEIDARLERVGFERENRAFRAHVTLARAKGSRLGSGLVSAASQFEDRDFGSFTVEQYFLYQSTLKPSGPVYTKLKGYALS
jgi:RNA 2',3'-cyclic 3'-phosphodiesterase